jgi:hypothetical protein
MERYLVFARTRYEDPLSQEGTLEIDAGDDAAARAARATERFGDHWLELVLIPAGALFWVPMGTTEAETMEAGV